MGKKLFQFYAQKFVKFIVPLFHDQTQKNIFINT